MVKLFKEFEYKMYSTSNHFDKDEKFGSGSMYPPSFMVYREILLKSTNYCCFFF